MQVDDTLFPYYHPSRFYRAVPHSIFGVVVMASLISLSANASDSADLDSDGVVDRIDQDQDNDGILNTLEGLHFFDPLSHNAAQYNVAQYFVALPVSASGSGMSYGYDLINTSNGHSALLNGRVLDTDTEVEWAMHDSLPKLRNLTNGSTTVQWTVEDSSAAGSTGANIDLTISDLDGNRAETIAISESSVVGYSLSLNSNVVVKRDNGQLSFTGTGTGGDSVDDAVTLHFRDTAPMVVTYSNGSGASLTESLAGQYNGEVEIAGYRHSLERAVSPLYTPVAQSRDSDGDGIADHRDLDSDNDGLGDVVESGGLDADNNNLIDGQVNSVGVALNADPNLDAEAVALVITASSSVYGDDPDADGLLSVVDGLPYEFGGSRAGVDSDNDGLDDLDEIRIYRTNPNTADSDNDGLTDHSEVQHYNTSPLHSDTDRDGLSDGDEVNVHNTIPTSVDTDADGIVDGVEIEGGTDPLQAEVVIVTEQGPGASSITSNPAIDPVAEANLEAIDDIPLTGQFSEAPNGNTVPVDNTALLFDDSVQGERESLRTGVNGAAGCSLMSSPEPIFPLILLIAIGYLRVITKIRKTNV